MNKPVYIRLTEGTNQTFNNIHFFWILVNLALYYGLLWAGLGAGFVEAEVTVQFFAARAVCPGFQPRWYVNTRPQLIRPLGPGTPFSPEYCT